MKAFLTRFALILIMALAGYAGAWLWLIRTGNRFTLRQLALQPGMSVVDVGCGSGRFTIPIAYQVGPTGEVTGIDIEARKIWQAQQRAKAAGVTNVHFERAGAGEGMLPPERFDRAVLF